MTKEGLHFLVYFIYTRLKKMKACDQWKKVKIYQYQPARSMLYSIRFWIVEHYLNNKGDKHGRGLKAEKRAPLLPTRITNL